MHQWESAPCSHCGSLPDMLVANTGREQYLPEPATALHRMDLADDHDLRRCTSCGAWFEWQDHPQMYGSGNNWEESLRRLGPATCAELERLLDGSGGDGSTPELDKVFDSLRSVAWLVFSTRAQTLERFLPAMVARLCTRNEQQLYQLLYGWAGSTSARREQILALLRAREPLAGYAKYMQECFSRP